MAHGEDLCTSMAVEGNYLAGLHGATALSMNGSTMWYRLRRQCWTS